MPWFIGIFGLSKFVKELDMDPVMEVQKTTHTNTLSERFVSSFPLLGTKYILSMSGFQLESRYLERRGVGMERERGVEESNRSVDIVNL